MKTSSKYRRLMRQRKLRRQRRAALLVFVALLIFVANVALSSQTDSADEVVAVSVQSGDTIWSIAREYMPEGVDFSEYVHNITVNNGIKDGNIYAGQIIYVPVAS